MGKIWRLERKMGSATVRDQRPKSNPALQEIPGLLIKLGSRFPETKPGDKSLHGIGLGAKQIVKQNN